MNTRTDIRASLFHILNIADGLSYSANLTTLSIALELLISEASCLRDECMRRINSENNYNNRNCGRCQSNPMESVKTAEVPYAEGFRKR